MAYTKTEICNLAQSNLGLGNVITNIDSPTNRTEKIYKQYYDLVLSKLYKRERPQFSIDEDNISPTLYTDGTYHYEVPSYCLEVLRVNGYDTNFLIERNEIIFDGIMIPNDGIIKIKYIRKITETGLFTDEWVELFSWELAYKCAPLLTQDVGMLQLASSGVNLARQEYQTANLRSAKPRLKTAKKFNKMWRRI